MRKKKKKKTHTHTHTNKLTVTLKPPIESRGENRTNLNWNFKIDNETAEEWKKLYTSKKNNDKLTKNTTHKSSSSSSLSRPSEKNFRVPLLFPPLSTFSRQVFFFPNEKILKPKNYPLSIAGRSYHNYISAHLKSPPVRPLRAADSWASTTHTHNTHTTTTHRTNIAPNSKRVVKLQPKKKKRKKKISWLKKMKGWKRKEKKKKRTSPSACLPSGKKKKKNKNVYPPNFSFGDPLTHRRKFSVVVFFFFFFYHSVARISILRVWGGRGGVLQKFVCVCVEKAAIYIKSFFFLFYFFFLFFLRGDFGDGLGVFFCLFFFFLLFFFFWESAQEGFLSRSP